MGTATERRAAPACCRREHRHARHGLHHRQHGKQDLLPSSLLLREGKLTLLAIPRSLAGGEGAHGYFTHRREQVSEEWLTAVPGEQGRGAGYCSPCPVLRGQSNKVAEKNDRNLLFYSSPPFMSQACQMPQTGEFDPSPALPSGQELQRRLMSWTTAFQSDDCYILNIHTCGKILFHVRSS